MNKFVFSVKFELNAFSAEDAWDKFNEHIRQWGFGSFNWKIKELKK